MRVFALLAAFILAIVPAVAEAGLLDSKTIIVSTNLNPNPSLQIAEVQAFETGTGINKAQDIEGAVASATSETFSTVAGDVNDGNTNGAFGAGSTWHSGNELNAAVTIELAQETQLESVNIWGRTDCCMDRQSDLTLTILDSLGNTLFQQSGIDASSGPATVLLPSTVIPEPASVAVVAGLAACTLIRRRRRA